MEKIGDKQDLKTLYNFSDSEMGEILRCSAYIVFVPSENGASSIVLKELFEKHTGNKLSYPKIVINLFNGTYGISPNLDGSYFKLGRLNELPPYISSFYEKKRGQDVNPKDLIVRDINTDQYKK